MEAGAPGKRPHQHDEQDQPGRQQRPPQGEPAEPSLEAVLQSGCILWPKRRRASRDSRARRHFCGDRNRPTLERNWPTTRGFADDCGVP
jgi:hypothetical protein